MRDNAKRVNAYLKKRKEMIADSAPDHGFPPQDSCSEAPKTQPDNFRPRLPPRSVQRILELYREERTSLQQAIGEGGKARVMSQQPSPALEVDQLRAQTSEIAHDLGNLLTTISLSSDQLLDRLPVDSPLRRLAVTIRTAATSCARLNVRLRTVADRSVRRPSSVDLNKVIENAEPLLRAIVPADVRLRIVPGSGVARVNANSEDLERVVMNLAINASEAIEGGGQLTILVEDTYLDEASAQEHPGISAGWYGKLVVQDTGKGIDKHTLTRIFEPSFSTKCAGKGRGLGLAIVGSLVKRSAGHIRVDSTPGVGTTFTILLPKCEKRH